MSKPKIPFSLGSIDYDQVNPWHIKDGKWGGFGPSQWWYGEKHGFARGDVIEWKYTPEGQRWWRIWVDAEQKWRELTAAEIKTLPTFRERHNVSFDKRIRFPIKVTKKDARALAAVLAQPLIQVIEQAPVMRDVFGKNPLDTPRQDE